MADRERARMEAAVLEANHEFYRAFSRGDYPAMSELWARHAPVACLHPGARLLSGSYYGQTLQLWSALVAAAILSSGLIGLIGLVVSSPQAASVLTAAGLAPLIAKGAVVCASLLDMALAVAVCFRRTAAYALQGMLLVSAVYLVAGTLLRPDLWLDPLGPLRFCLR